MTSSGSDYWTDEEHGSEELLSFEEGTATSKRRQRASAKLKRLVADVCESIENICGSLCNVDNTTACQNITVEEVLDALKMRSPPEGCWAQLSPSCDPAASASTFAERSYSVSTEDIFDGTFPVEDEDMIAYRKARCKFVTMTGESVENEIGEYLWLQGTPTDLGPSDEEEFDRISDHAMNLKPVTRSGFKDDRMVAMVVL